jgi:hypothetical protein
MDDSCFIPDSEEVTPRTPPAPEREAGPTGWGPATNGTAPNALVQEDDSSGISRENLLNRERLRIYKRFSERFLELIAESEFEFGFDSAADVFVRDRLAENALATKDWIDSLFIEHYADAAIATRMLRVIGHLDYHLIAPQGPTMALAALAHSSLEVRECGVRAFENWGTLECLRVLESVSCSEKWMEDYVRQVVVDLKELLLRVPAGQED